MLSHGPQCSKDLLAVVYVIITYAWNPKKVVGSIWEPARPGNQHKPTLAGPQAHPTQAHRKATTRQLGPNKSYAQ